MLKKWWNNLSLGLLHPHLPTHSCLHCRNRTCCVGKVTFQISSWLMRQQQSTVNFINIKTTLEMSQAILLFLPWKSLVFSLRFLPPLHLHNNHYSFSNQPFLYIFSPPLFSWSSSIYHALVSCYSLTLSSPLLPLQHLILLFSITTSTPAITEITALL